MLDAAGSGYSAGGVLAFFGGSAHTGQQDRETTGTIDAEQYPAETSGDGTDPETLYQPEEDGAKVTVSTVKEIAGGDR